MLSERKYQVSSSLFSRHHRMSYRVYSVCKTVSRCSLQILMRSLMRSMRAVVYLSFHYFSLLLPCPLDSFKQPAWFLQGLVFEPCLDRSGWAFSYRDGQPVSFGGPLWPVGGQSLTNPPPMCWSKPCTVFLSTY